MGPVHFSSHNSLACLHLGLHCDLFVMFRGELVGVATFERTTFARSAQTTNLFGASPGLAHDRQGQLLVIKLKGKGTKLDKGKGTKLDKGKGNKLGEGERH